MKIFAVFIFCFLTPLIVNAGVTQEYNCVCVDVNFCNDQFSGMIRPRSLRQECNIGNQVCCRPEHITQFPNQNLSPPSDFNPNTDKCGRRNQITNNYGRLVTPNYLVNLGEIPWQVAILRNSSVGTFFISSGALLNQYAILTTAHTLNSLYPDQVIARLGENNFQADPSRRYPALNARISRIIVDKDFNRNTLENDVAVLCLNSPVKLSETINPVCLPDPTDFIGDSARCVVSGWGKNSFNGNYSTILRKSYQNLLPVDICSDQLRVRVQDPSYRLGQTFICANGKAGRDATCTGDAGSPLTCTNKNGQQVLVGISSWGIDCGEPNVPGVYANVRDPATFEWIKNSIQECTKTAPPPPPMNYNEYPTPNNNDYTVVNYNSNNYNPNPNQNYPSSNYNPVNNNNNYNPQSDYNTNYNGQSDYNPINNNNNYNFNNPINNNNNYNNNNNPYNNPPSDYYSNSIEYTGRSFNSPTETANSAVESEAEKVAK